MSTSPTSRTQRADQQGASEMKQPGPQKFYRQQMTQLESLMSRNDTPDAHRASIARLRAKIAAETNPEYIASLERAVAFYEHKLKES